MTNAMYGSLLLADPGGVLVWAGLTAFAAGLMRGFAGFGSAILMAPIFAVLLGPVHMVPMVASIEIPMGVMLFFGARGAVEWKFVGPLAAVAIAAMPIGIWLLVSLDSGVITKAVSVIVLLFVIVLITGWRYRGPRPLALTLGIGGVSGAMMATTSVGGPPVLLYMLAAEMPAATIRANIIAYYLLTGFVLVTMVMLASPTGSAALIDAIILMPVILVGSWIGSRLAGKAAEQTYRWIAYTFLGVAGLIGLFG
ncbi:MAG: sulfite exporter TauE/SafE family protein [Alphaproteobacteria bacterium]|nr:sulfite exporter TauE/SafE family protein [Alphaproteobacteria bacterium]